MGEGDHRRWWRGLVERGVGGKAPGMDPRVRPKGDEDGKISARYGRVDGCQWSPKGADEACQRHPKNGSEDRAASDGWGRTSASRSTTPPPLPSATPPPLRRGGSSAGGVISVCASLPTRLRLTWRCSSTPAHPDPPPFMGEGDHRRWWRGLVERGVGERAIGQRVSGLSVSHRRWGGKVPAWTLGSSPRVTKGEMLLPPALYDAPSVAFGDTSPASQGRILCRWRH